MDNTLVVACNPKLVKMCFFCSFFGPKSVQMCFFLVVFFENIFFFLLCFFLGGQPQYEDCLLSLTLVDTDQESGLNLVTRDGGGVLGYTTLVLTWLMARG